MYIPFMNLKMDVTLGLFSVFCCQYQETFKVPQENCEMFDLNSFEFRIKNVCCFNITDFLKLFCANYSSTTLLYKLMCGNFLWRYNLSGR